MGQDKKKTKRRFLFIVAITLATTVNLLFSSSGFATPTSPTTTKSKVNQALAQYNAAKQDVEDLQQKIALSDKRMNDTFQHLALVEQSQAKTKKRLDQVMVRLYTSGQNNLEVQLLSAKSFSEFLGRLEAIRLLMDNDYQIYHQFKQQADEIKQNQTAIQKEAAQSKPLLLAAEQKMKQLQTQYKTLQVELKKEQTQQHAKKSQSSPIAVSDPGKISDQSWLNKARAMIGKVQYRFGAESYPYFDCSGWVQYVFRTYRGINIPRTSSAQSTIGIPVAKSNIQPGDLIFLQGTYKSGVSHVGIALGNGYYISNENEELDLQIDSLNGSYSQTHYWGARRVN